MNDRDSISLQQNLALIHKPRDQDILPNAMIVAVEETVQLLDGNDTVRSTEYVCTIVGYADMLLPRSHATEAVFQGYMTIEDHRSEVVHNLK